jgi:hypothetical protein
VDADHIKAKVAQLASLPEQEWRTEIANLVIKLTQTNDTQLEIITNVEETMNRKFTKGEERFENLDRNVGEVVEILRTIKSGLVIFSWIGKGLKWFTIAIGAVTAIFTAIVAGDKAIEVVKAVGKIK